MGPKKGGGKKKGKKSGAKGSAKKRGDAPGDTVTFTEAVRTYQLEVKQMHLNTLQESVLDWKAKNDRQRQRNVLLRKEQNNHIKDVIAQAHENEVNIKSVEEVPFEHVERALQEKLSAINIEKDAVQDLKKKIEGLDKDIEVLSLQLHQLHQYRESGQHVDKTHITVMQKEMEDMDNSYAEMANFFDKSLASMKQTITKQNYENIAVQKDLASEVVIKGMDKQTEQELQDNEWLNKEVSIHRNHIMGAEFEIKMLEKQNIEIMSYLFEQQVDDVKQTRKFYLSCKEADEKEDDLLLQDDGDNDGVDGGDSTSDNDGDNGETFECHGRVSETEEEPHDVKWLDEYLHEFDATANEEEYKLGPVEVKLLCVVGNKAPLHDVTEMVAEGIMTSSTSEPHYNWVVEKEELRLASITEVS